jgi:hypothetical protein
LAFLDRDHHGAAGAQLGFEGRRHGLPFAHVGANAKPATTVSNGPFSPVAPFEFP